jgi:hypothetical protein
MKVVVDRIEEEPEAALPVRRTVSCIDILDEEI